MAKKVSSSQIINALKIEPHIQKTPEQMSEELIARDLDHEAGLLERQGELDDMFPERITGTHYETGITFSEFDF